MSQRGWLRVAALCFCYQRVQGRGVSVPQFHMQMTATANPSKKALLSFLKGPDPWWLLLKIVQPPADFTINLIYISSITAD